MEGLMAAGRRRRTARGKGPAARAEGAAAAGPAAARPSAWSGGRLTGLVGLSGLMAWAQFGDALAGPEGGVVRHGAAVIQRNGTGAVIEQATPRAQLSWESFDIGRGESVQFRQPSTSSIALNSIRNNRPTEIQGNLTANGQVWLENPAGVLFGRDAAVDVGGLMATTAQIDADDFAAGRDRFAGGQGSVVNEGAIAAGEGGVALVSPVVENHGTIETRGGDVAMAAATGFTVDMHGDGVLGMVVE